MSTFLQLCVSLQELAGVTNSPMTTTSSQTGVNLRVVNWVKNAWIDIQNLHTEWLFLRQDLSFTTSSSQSYTTTAMSATTLRRMDNESLRIYLTATGVADEQPLSYMDWETFRNTYLFGTRQSGRPVCFSVDPATKTLWLNSNPGTGYTIVGYFWRSPVTLSANSDEPAMPSEYHMLVVYRALMKYAGFEAASEAKAEAVENYGPMMSALELNQLPDILMAGPLA